MTAVATGLTQQGSGKLDEFEVSGEPPYYAEEREGWKSYVEWEACQRTTDFAWLDNFLTLRLELPREEKAR